METLASTAPTTHKEDAIISVVMNTDILMHLPAESIGRFRCVSKRLKSYLSSPKFIKDHINFRRTDDPEYLISSHDESVSPYVTTFTPEGENDAVSRKLKINPLWSLEVAAGSCNGLVLLRHRSPGRVLVLANPITLEDAVIYADQSPWALGLGYDASTDDYKIVATYDYSEMDIYSVRTRSWRGPNNRKPCPYKLGHSDQGVFVNGRIHWVHEIEKDDDDGGWNINTSKLGSLVAFDLAKEVFEQVPLPDGAEKHGKFSLGVLDGCLAFVSKPTKHEGFDNKVSDVWVMKEYGVADSWTMIASIEISKDRRYKAVHVLNEDEIAFINGRYNGQMVVYNRKNGAQRSMVIDGVPRRFSSHSCMSFKASLVSPLHKQA